MRSWLQLLGVAACSVAAVAVAAFSAQALLLPRPTQRELVAGAIMAHLLTYRSIGGQAQLDGRAAPALCTRHAVRHGSHDVSLAEDVVFGNEHLVGSPSAPLRPHTSPLVFSTFMTAGCPISLSEMIGNWLDRRIVRVRTATVRGAAAYELAVGWPSRRVTLFVSRLSLAPLMVRVHAGRTDGSSVIGSTRSGGAHVSDTRKATGRAA